MKHICTIYCLLLFCTTVFSQKKDSLAFNNRLYKREVGIDFKGLFNGGPGGALTYKVRRDKGDLIAVSYSDYLRFSAYLGGYASFLKKDTFTYQNQILELYDNEYISQSLEFNIGKERVYYYGRFNLYYGMDIGLSGNYRAENGASLYVLNVNGGYTYLRFPLNRLNAGVAATPFFGMKYRIGERFSITLESAYTLRYALERLRYYEATSGERVFSGLEHNIQHAFYPLRFLTFNYHFKKY